MGQISDIHYSEILVATVKLLIKKVPKLKEMNEFMLSTHNGCVRAISFRSMEIRKDTLTHHVDFIEL